MFDRCRAWRAMLTRRAEGVLSPSERALLENHLTKCAPCRKIQAADEALNGLCFARHAGVAAGSERAFDDRVVTELRALPLADASPMGWRETLRACSAGVSFEFCLQLAGGGLAAAAITAFALVSALNPVPTAKNLSAYEIRSLSAAERNEPPVPLEALFQASTPRAAMLWAAPGRPQWRPQGGDLIVAPRQSAKPGQRGTSPHRRGARAERRFDFG